MTSGGRCRHARRPTLSCLPAAPAICYAGSRAATAAATTPLAPRHPTTMPTPPTVTYWRGRPLRRRPREGDAGMAKGGLEGVGGGGWR